MSFWITSTLFVFLTKHRPHRQRKRPLVLSPTGQRSWGDALAKSKDDSASQVHDKESRLQTALCELEDTRKELVDARARAASTAEALQEEREALSVSRARTSELHKLGVDMERELTAMLEGSVCACMVRLQAY